MNPLKSQDGDRIVDAQIVDEIFFMVPAILNTHERFLDELRRRLDSWDAFQKVGDAFFEVVS
jgi:Rho guanine nucleotide exchange factor 17